MDRRARQARRNVKQRRAKARKAHAVVFGSWRDRLKAARSPRPPARPVIVGGPFERRDVSALIRFFATPEELARDALLSLDNPQ